MPGSFATGSPSRCSRPSVLLVHGYHPLADDGAVYVTGIKKLADPGLYQTDAVFALSPTRLSIFAHVLAAAASLGTHFPAGPAAGLPCGFDLSLPSRLVESGGTDFPRPAGALGSGIARCLLLHSCRSRAHRFPSWIPTSRRAPFPLRSCSSRWRPFSTSNGWLPRCGSLWPRCCIP